MEIEREFLGGRRSKMWTYFIVFGVLAVGAVVVNFVLANPTLAREGVDQVLGLPGWGLAAIVGVIGLVIYWLGLKVETDWPEALGAILVVGSIVAGEIMIGWDKFRLGGLSVVPFVIPALVFLVLLAYGMTRSR